jgi:hypothetical protein
MPACMPPKATPPHSLLKLHDQTFGHVSKSLVAPVAPKWLVFSACWSLIGTWQIPYRFASDPLHEPELSPRFSASQQAIRRRKLPRPRTRPHPNPPIPRSLKISKK